MLIHMYKIVVHNAHLAVVSVFDNNHANTAVHVHGGYTYIGMYSYCIIYSIARKFGGELNLAVWRFQAKPPN